MGMKRNGRQPAEFILRKKGESISILDVIIQVNTLLIVVGAGVVLYHFQHQFQEIRNLMLNSIIGTLFYYFSIFVLGFKALFFLFLLVHYWRYKPINSALNEELPSITVLVPAFNEGQFVYFTLKSIVESNYPREKIQLIAIDDGSKDDTWTWIQKAQTEFGGNINAIRFLKNEGKRAALYKGFELGTGDVYVTIDSDSVIGPDTLRNLATPFILDSNCGAVAGNVKILNHKRAIIPKMLNGSFAFSFEFIRAAQSAMGTVLCTPGALSAYRKKAVNNCVEDWINQTFLGVKTDIGEDRAMTNMILAQGYHVLFQSNAIVYTTIPETFKPLKRMFTRWERSNVRENIKMGRFVLKKFRSGNLANPRILLFNQWLNLVSAFPTLGAMLFIIASYPRLFLSSTVISVALFSIIPAAFYALKYNKRKTIWIFTYNIFYSFTLFWITPYAILTTRRRGWLTRQ